MGASASHRFIPSPNRIVPVDESTLLLANQIRALRLILNNEPFAHSFEEFLDSVKREKLVFVKYYAELHRLKAMLLEKSQHHDLMSEGDLSNVRDLVLNNSAKIYLLYYPSKKTNKDVVELHHEGLVAKCLLPLLSLNEAEQNEKSMIDLLVCCQSSLLLHLMDELTLFVASQKFFLSFQTSPILTHRNIFEQVLLRTKGDSFDYPEYARGSSSCRVLAGDDEECSFATHSRSFASLNSFSTICLH